MIPVSIALASFVEAIDYSELSEVAAAIQLQVTRDFGPIWAVEATVSAFPNVEAIPPGYWPVVVRDDLTGTSSYHKDFNKQPFAIIAFDKHWKLAVSHEVLEMLADPWGSRLIPGESLKDGQGSVLYLLEVCDPCQDPDLGYLVNGITMSNFYTPKFFDPVSSIGVRYDFRGAISRPRQVLNNGYISWLVPGEKSAWQKTVIDGKEDIQAISYFGDKTMSLSLRERIDLKSGRRARLSKSEVAKPVASHRNSAAFMEAMERAIRM